MVVGWEGSTKNSCSSWHLCNVSLCVDGRYFSLLFVHCYLSRDLKEHLRRLQQQSDTRRRAAVMEMMRQRAAEIAGSAG